MDTYMNKSIASGCSLALPFFLFVYTKTVFVKQHSVRVSVVLPFVLFSKKTVLLAYLQRPEATGIGGVWGAEPPENAPPKRELMVFPERASP